MRDPSPRSCGPLLQLVHGGLAAGTGRGGVLARTRCSAATEGMSSPRKHLEKEGTEGNLTAMLVGVGVARFGRATVRQSGGGPSSVGGQYG
jgi:hypothetical protein